MSTDAPDKIIVLLHQPMMTKSLYVEIVYLKARVVNVVLGA